MAKTLQLLRNATLYQTYAAAKEGLIAQLSAASALDGEPILARYTETVQGVTKQRTLLGIKSPAGYEIFDNAGTDTAIQAAVTALDNQLKAVAKSGAAADVSIADSGEHFTATNVEGALAELAGSIASNAVSSTDNTVIVTPGAQGDTDLAVNIDGTTIIKTTTGEGNAKGKLSTNLEVVELNSTEIAALQDNNVKEAYKLIYHGDANRTAMGSVVKIYKDSSLHNVYLGHTDDTVDSSTGDVTSGTGDTALCFVYLTAAGTYQLVAINVENFLEENEFKAGLQVSNHEVSVKKDATSGKVRIADTPSGVTPGSAEDTGLVDVFTIDQTDANAGLKINNIQEAINYAVAGGSAALTVEAVGDTYVGASIDPNNNKKVVVATDVQTLTATAGTPGTYDANGAETVAPTAGTLTGVADSLADSSDIASKVKTYVDGAIAIEAARSDAKNKADIAALDSSQSATAASGNVYSVLTGITQTDGKLTGKTEVTLAAVAKTGAAADVSIADVGNKFTATNVEAALAEIVATIEDNEEVTSAALNDLNDRVDALDVFDCGTY